MSPQEELIERLKEHRTLLDGMGNPYLPTYVRDSLTEAISALTRLSGLEEAARAMDDAAEKLLRAVNFAEDNPGEVTVAEYAMGAARTLLRTALSPP